MAKLEGMTNDEIQKEFWRRQSNFGLWAKDSCKNNFAW